MKVGKDWNAIMVTVADAHFSKSHFRAQILSLVKKNKIPSVAFLVAVVSLQLFLRKHY